MNNRFPNLGIWQRDWEPPGNLTLEACGIWLQKLHRPGETDSWRTQTKPCAQQDPGERSGDPTRDWPRLACECPGASGGGVCWQWPAAGLEALSAAVYAWDLLKEVDIIFSFYHSLVSGQATGKEHSPTHQHKIGLTTYWAYSPAHQNKTRFPPQSFSPIRKLP